MIDGSLHLPCAMPKTGVWSTTAVTSSSSMRPSWTTSRLFKIQSNGRSMSSSWSGGTGEFCTLIQICHEMLIVSLGEFSPTQRQPILLQLMQDRRCWSSLMAVSVGICDANVTQARCARHRFDACGDSQGRGATTSSRVPFFISLTWTFGRLQIGSYDSVWTCLLVYNL